MLFTNSSARGRNCLVASFRVLFHFVSFITHIKCLVCIGRVNMYDPVGIRVRSSWWARVSKIILPLIGIIVVIVVVVVVSDGGSTVPPTVRPTVRPTASPVNATSSPTSPPTASPTSSPTSSPTVSPTVPVPTTSPTSSPTSSPTASPTVRYCTMENNVLEDTGSNRAGTLAGGSSTTVQQCEAFCEAENVGGDFCYGYQFSEDNGSVCNIITRSDNLAITAPGNHPDISRDPNGDPNVDIYLRNDYVDLVSTAWDVTCI